MLAHVCLALSIWAAPLPQAPERQAVAWQRSLEDALATQQATGLPLLIAVNMDGEVFNDAFAGTVYRDPAFIETTRGYVCVVASPDRHSERDYDALGNRIECPRFGGCTCSEHINIEPELFRRYFDGKRNAPRHVGISKAGKVLFDRFLDASMQTAIDAIGKHRGRASAAPAPTDDIAELFRRRDALARTLLERRYRDGDRETRRRLLEAAAAADNQPLDLLRMGLRDEDRQLCGLAALALSKVAATEALIDIEDALARIDDADIRAALIAQLRELGKTDADAERLASHFAAVDSRLPVPWRNPWRDGMVSRDRPSIEAALDRAEGAIRLRPDDAVARLELATAQAAYATLLAWEGGQGVELWFADAERNAGLVAGEALQPETEALTAICAWYGSDPVAAGDAIAVAMAQNANDRQPARWLAENFFDVVLQVTAGDAFRRAEQDANASLRGELNRVRTIFELLAERGCGEERGMLAGIGLLEFGGLRAEAQRQLLTLALRFPGSVAVHERWRNRLLIDLGAELMRHTYANYVTKVDDKATAQWFAGYAALVAGDRHTLDERRIEAENAYGDAAERFVASAAANPDYVETAHHYAALALAGRAVIRQARGNAAGAVADLLRAAELRPETLDEDDGLQRKPRVIADRLARELRSAGQIELADRLQPILP